MAVPDYQTFMRPLLSYGADGVEKSIRDAISVLSEEFKLTPEERAQTIPSGTETLVSNRIHWARTYLGKAGALVRTSRAHFLVTARGMSLLKQYPDRIDVKILRQFPEFQKFQAPKARSTEPSLSGAPESTVSQSATPDERIDAAIAEIQSRLQSDLLDRITEQSPAFFEGLVIDLIVAMGYGGSKENVVQRIGRSGDEGIDGIVNEDPLGLDVVYVQAKKYDPKTTISREKLQAFSGALVGKNASKGIFVATCSFSKHAEEYAERVPQRIILIDGEELVRLLIRYGVGVRLEREIQIKRIDLDYFEKDDL
ncbi:MAG TPA: restriction endonuclease [Rhizomicrobium sp.]|jgi:restriction system protein|nr:restriction endonuclease [Rhizomicrobium sp.]